MAATMMNVVDGRRPSILLRPARMGTLEELAARVEALESWANREALRRGAYGFIVERMFADHLASLPLEECERILGDLSNPYRFATSVQGPAANNERVKRAVGEAASRQVEEVVETLRRRAAQLRQDREARATRPADASCTSPSDPMRD